jgi:hypothetical protein
MPDKGNTNPYQAILTKNNSLNKTKCRITFASITAVN